MSGETIEISPKVKAEINQLAQSMGIAIPQLIEILIGEYKTYHAKINNISKDLHFYKERELHAFAIGDALYDGIYVMERNGTIIAVNKAFTKMTGIGEDDIIGKNVRFLVENKIVAESTATKVLVEKKKVSALSTINNQKIIITGNPIFDKNGEVSQVLTVMRDVTELIKLQEQIEYSEKLSKKYLNELNYFRKKEIGESGLIGQNESIQQIKELINQVAKVDVTVLITGETGVGKEVVAREIYKNSPRKNSPYIKVNCAAIPETLLESELFGYEKGAFTGAQPKEKLGLFEIANTGTILLDEIGEMPLNLQTKLLRVLQEKEITRIGGTVPIKLDVRIIAITNHKLEQHIKEGRFREDLYYRLNVIPIQIPPLRSRKEDILILVNHFLQKFNQKYGKNKQISINTLDIMEEYDWPGNIRELENIIERLIVIVDKPVIEPMHIIKILDNKKTSPDYFNKSNLTLNEAVRIVEKQMIEKALKNYGSTHKAARVLGVSQPTIVRKAKKLRIES